MNSEPARLAQLLLSPLRSYLSHMPYRHITGVILHSSKAVTIPSNHVHTPSPEGMPLPIQSAIRRFVILSIVLIQLSVSISTHAADWPAWRMDSGRTASTPEQLPTELHLQWSLELGELKPAWPEDMRLQFDAAYQPIVVGKSMYVSSSRNDSVSAYELATGILKWRFFADGPVRFAPVVHDGKAYFGSDDGYFYCLDAIKGTLIWRHRVAPSPRRAIGNERLVSVWPMRGGPVLVDDQIHFTVGVWPFEGTMLLTLDTTADSPAFTVSTLSNLSPQGYLAASGGRLVIPCGRANIYCQDLKTGKRVGVRYSAKGTTDFHTSTSGKWLFHGNKVVDVQSKITSKLEAYRPVISDDTLYFVVKGTAVAYDLKNQKVIEKKGRSGPTKTLIPNLTWQLKKELVTTVHIKAGNRLYAHHGKSVIAIELPADGDEPTVAWKKQIDGTPASMLAADEKLLVVTAEGTIHCFDGDETKPKRHILATGEIPTKDQDTTNDASLMLKHAGVDRGYCLAIEIGSGSLISELLRQSKLTVIAIDPDAAKVDRLRRKFDALGIYGTRIVAHVGDPLKFELPPYLASMVVVDGSIKTTESNSFVQAVFHTLRPYGGSALLKVEQVGHGELAKAARDTKLSNASINRQDGLTILRRDGALKESADWTHEWGDPANTLMSQDKLVKAPLGVLWFGGPASNGDLFYDRHMWGPSMAVIEGRMFIQGPGKFTAVDVYTGRILWQNALTQQTSPGRRANWRPTGFHFVATEDSIYLATPQKCIRLDPKTGMQLAEFTLPDKDDAWGRFRISKDRLIVTAYSKQEKTYDPIRLVAMNRMTGKVLWKQKSESTYPLVAIGSDKVFVYEGEFEGLYAGADKRRRGGVPQAKPIISLKAFDADTGDELWSRSATRIATWMAYSEKHDILLASNKKGINAWRGKGGDELWNKVAEGEGFRGHPENYWDKVIIWNDQILDQRGPGSSYSLLTGKPTMVANPITGQSAPWEFTKSGHHCNYAIASEHLMTFRAASAGFTDLATGGTGRLDGFRSGCRNSLIPANGVLNAPNFAHGCVCSYSIFTSLALVHVPESDIWTYTALNAGSGPVKRLGINFGAPGDRQDKQGTLWLDYPGVGGSSPKVPVKVSGSSIQWFRNHTATIKGEGLHWVAASGARGVTSITIPLTTGKPSSNDAKRSYTVRLYFAEPTDGRIGQDIFNISIEGQVVTKDLDVVKETGGARISLVKKFANIEAGQSLTVQLTSKKGNTLISGIEVVADEN